MIPHRHWILLGALAFASASLAGCGKTAAKSSDEVLSLPFRGVRAGVRGIGQSVSKVLLDRNRAALLREHKNTRTHLKAVETFIERRKIDLVRSENRLLQDASDRLASVGRQLEAKRIPSGVGLRMYRQLESVRQSLDLIRRRHNTPRYTGFIADR